MRRPLVVAIAIALVSLAVPSSDFTSSAVAAAGKRDGCPARLGSLRFASSAVDEENANKREISCLYRSEDYSKNVVLRVSWLVPSASPVWLSDLEPNYCLRTDEDYVGPGQHGDKTRTGHSFPHAGDLYILAGYLATPKGPSVDQIKAVGRKLVSKHAALAATCPGASAPLTPAVDQAATVTDVGISETTIVLSGSATEATPTIGTPIDLPEDDQHRLVIGGLTGEVIREEPIGSRGTVTGYGPLVTDENGDWAVLVTVETDAPETAERTEAPTEEPVQERSTEEPTEEPDPTEAPEPTEDDSGTSAGVDPDPEPAASVRPTPEPTPNPPPQAISGLSDEGNAAVNNVHDHIWALGDSLELGRDLNEDGTATAIIPASDIESLRALAPSLAQSVHLETGSIVVNVGGLEVWVSPVIGDDGLIEVELSNSALNWVKDTKIVQSLVRALNKGVTDRDGRFLPPIVVTETGITVTAEGPQSE
jgi:hypothetical protein